MKRSSVASLETEKHAVLGRRFSVLEMEHSGVELGRHKESSSKLQRSTDPKISVKWREPAVFGQHHVSLWPRSRPFFALKRFELREAARHLQQMMERRGAGEPLFSVNGCCDAMRLRG